MVRKYKYTLILSALILYLSLKNADEINKVKFLDIPHFDKIVHFWMYFMLMSVVIYESVSATARKSIITYALFPFFYGILIEILQHTITTTRSGSAYDALFNTMGIIFALFSWYLYKKYKYGKFK